LQQAHCLLAIAPHVPVDAAITDASAFRNRFQQRQAGWQARGAQVDDTAQAVPVLEQQHVVFTLDNHPAGRAGRAPFGLRASKDGGAEEGGQGKDQAFFAMDAGHRDLPPRVVDSFPNVPRESNGHAMTSEADGMADLETAPDNELARAVKLLDSATDC
jgi:hypothetical protein